MLRSYKKAVFDPISGKLRQSRLSFSSQPSQIYREHLLHNLLDEERILEHLHTFETQYEHSALPLKNPGSSINAIMQKIFPFIAEQNELSDWLRVLPINAHECIQPQTGSINMSFRRVQEVVKFLPELDRAYITTSIVGALLRWQYCRCILVIYQFLSTDLPHLATVLFMGHQSFLPPASSENPHPDANPEGDKWIQDHYPRYAPLVLHIIEYVKTWVRLCKKTKRRASASASDPPVGYDQVPYDLFGVREGQGPPIELPPLLKSLQYGPGPRYHAARECFIKLIEDTIVLPTLPDADSHFNKGRARSGSPDLGAIRSRCIVRGAILQCIILHLETEAICASEHMHALLQSPTLIFYGHSVNESRISPFVVAHKPEFIAPLRRWLRLHVTPGARDATIKLGHFFQRCSLEFQFHHPLTYEQYFEGVSPKQIATKNSKSTNNRGPGPILTPTLDTLLATQDAPHYGGPLLLIDEALRKATGQPAKRSQARLFLDGHHPGEGKKHHSHGDPDQVNPIREFNIGAGLLRKKIPPNKLTGPKGTSSL